LGRFWGSGPWGGIDGGALAARNAWFWPLFSVEGRGAGGGERARANQTGGPTLAGEHPPRRSLKTPAFRANQFSTVRKYPENGMVLGPQKEPVAGGAWKREIFRATTRRILPHGGVFPLPADGRGI